jgi:hypothetical protein
MSSRISPGPLKNSFRRPGNRRGRTRSAALLRGIVNYSAIGVVASALADMTHEVLGHLMAAWLTGDRVISLSSVAIQTMSASRFVAGAGTTANLAAGALSLVCLRASSKRGVGKGTYLTLFLWLFAAFNLLNSGYLVVSSVLGSGDWAVVIRGLDPILVWRVAFAVVGIALYVRSIHWLSRCMAGLVESKDITVSDLRRFVIAGYLAGGSVMTLASAFNPISPALILVSGIGASFGLLAGILLIPTAMRRQFPGRADAASAPASFSLAWICAAAVVGGVFIAVFGPGIRFGA